MDNDILWKVAVGALSSLAANNAWTFEELQEQIFTETNQREGKMRRDIARKSAIRTGKLEPAFEAFKEAEENPGDAFQFLREQMQITEKLRKESWPKALDSEKQYKPEVFTEYFGEASNR